MDALNPLPPATWEPKQFRNWYESIADLELQGISSSKEIAFRLGRSPVTIGLIRRSDLYKAYYAERRGEINARMHEEIADGMAKVAKEGLDIMHATLKKDKDKVGLAQVQSITEGVLDRAGYGPKSAGTAVNVQVNAGTTVVAPVSAGELARARARMLRTQQEIAAQPRAPDTVLDLPVSVERGNGEYAVRAAGLPEREDG